MAFSFFRKKNKNEATRSETDAASSSPETAIVDPFDFPFRYFGFPPPWINAPAHQFLHQALAGSNANVDWRETREAHVFMADVPGLTMEELQVRVVAGRILEISGEEKKKKDEATEPAEGKKEEKDKNIWHRMERAVKSFKRRFKLPGNANVEETNAKLQDGVLTVTVPKDQQANRNVRVIEVTGD